MPSERSRANDVQDVNVAKLIRKLRRMALAIDKRAAKGPSENRDAASVASEQLKRIATRVSNTAPTLTILRSAASVEARTTLLTAVDEVSILGDLIVRALDGGAAAPSFLGEAARAKLALAKLHAAEVLEAERRAFEDERRRADMLISQALRSLLQSIEHIEKRARRR